MAQTVTEGLAPLIARGAVGEGEEGLQVKDHEIVGFYAASVLQRVRNSDVVIASVDWSATSP
jgi:hypothetical protein